MRKRRQRRRQHREQKMIIEFEEENEIEIIRSFVVHVCAADVDF